MGGKSISTFSTQSGMGVFDGTCAIVPFLKAPGFCKISTGGVALFVEALDSYLYFFQVRGVARHMPALHGHVRGR